MEGTAPCSIRAAETNRQQLAATDAYLKSLEQLSVLVSSGCIGFFWVLWFLLHDPTEEGSALQRQASDPPETGISFLVFSRVPNKTYTEAFGGRHIMQTQCRLPSGQQQPVVCWYWAIEYGQGRTLKSLGTRVYYVESCMLPFGLDTAGFQSPCGWKRRSSPMGMMCECNADTVGVMGSMGESFCQLLQKPTASEA